MLRTLYTESVYVNLNYKALHDIIVTPNVAYLYIKNSSTTGTTVTLNLAVNFKNTSKYNHYLHYCEYYFKLIQFIGCLLDIKHC